MITNKRFCWTTSGTLLKHNANGQYSTVELVSHLDIVAAWPAQPGPVLQSTTRTYDTGKFTGCARAHARLSTKNPLRASPAAAPAHSSGSAAGTFIYK
jgi:hypothetical protein